MEIYRMNEPYKVVESAEEKQKFMKIYLHWIRDFFTKALNAFKNKRGYGIEFIGIAFYSDFDEWEKEYRCKEDEVALMFDYPAEEEDTIIYYSLEEFYDYLFDHGHEYIQKY